MPEWIHTLTVGSSHDHPSCVIGIGIVIQQRADGSGRGPIIAQLAEAHAGGAIGSAEELAILRAVEIAHQHGFERVKIRSDDNALRHNLREHHRAGNPLPEKALRAEILRVARRFSWIDFGWVPRRKNQMARGLARRGRHLPPGVSMTVDTGGNAGS